MGLRGMTPFLQDLSLCFLFFVDVEIDGALDKCSYHITSVCGSWWTESANHEPKQSLPSLFLVSYVGMVLRNVTST